MAAGRCLAAPVVLFVILGLVFHWTWLTWIFVMVMAIMVGALFATLTLTNRADKVGYAHLEGKPGAAVSVLSNISKAGFNFPEQPVWFDAKTKDAIWRGTGFKRHLSARRGRLRSRDARDGPSGACHQGL